MKIVNTRLKFKGDISTLVWCGDWHLGSKSCSLDALDCLNDRIMSKGYQWIHAADSIEGITPSDKRFDMDEAEESVVEQVQMAVDRIKAMGKTCLGMLKGNHEAAPSKMIGDITNLICKQAKIENLSQTCYMNLDAPHGNSTAFLTHYMPSINNRNEDGMVREAAKSSRLRKVLRKFQADLKLGAHIHHFICHVPVSEDRLVLEGDKLKHRPVQTQGQWIATCPAFLKVYDNDNYAQAKLYDPTDIGWVEIDFNKKAQVVEIRNMLGDGTVKRAYHAVLVD